MENKVHFREIENLLRIKMDEKAVWRNHEAIKLNGHSSTSFSKARILPTASLKLIHSYNSILNQTADILLPSQGPLNHWNAGWKKNPQCQMCRKPVTVLVEAICRGKCLAYIMPDKTLIVYQFWYYRLITSLSMAISFAEHMTQTS